MKIIPGLLFLLPLCAAASMSSVTPQSLQSSVNKIGASDTVRSLDEAGMKKLSEKISEGDSAWIATVPALAPALDGGNAKTITDALAIALPLNPAAVLAVLSAKTTPSLPGLETVCSMPFSDDKDDSWLAHYYTQSYSALKKMPEEAKTCREQLDKALTRIKDVANKKQKSPLNRQKITPNSLQESINVNGVDSVVSQLSTKQVEFISDSISQGQRNWLLIADSLAPTKDSKMRSMLIFSLASALANNPGDVLTVIKGNFDVGLICAMPFPEAKKQALSQYYQKTRKALLNLHRRGKECLDILDQEEATMVQSPDSQ